MPQKGWRLDLSRCVGCHACAIACKAENNTAPSTTQAAAEQLTVRNGVPVTVNFRQVATIDSDYYPTPKRTFVSMSCNHCASPACVAACPLDPPAITKRASDGIVTIDDTRCVGCRYCEAACPYGAPQYNEVSGKVEKCTGCVHRIDAGLEPACVTTCVGKALTWGDFNAAGGNGEVPDGFANPRLTGPSILFVKSW